MEDDEDDTYMSVVDTLIESQQVSAKKIKRVIHLHGGDLMSWIAEGDVRFHSKLLRRVNFTNLLSKVVPSKS